MRHRVLALLAVLPGVADARGPVTPKELIETADISGLSLSPDGRIAVYRRDLPSIARNTVLLDWFAVPVDGSAPPRAIASGGDAIVRDNGTLAPETPLWTPDGRYLLFRTLEDGKVQVKRVGADGNDARIVAAGPADVIRFALLRSGDIIVETGPTRAEIAQAEQREYNDGIVLDETIEPGQALFRGGWINGRRATQRLSGDWFDRRGLLGASPSRYTIFPAAGGPGRGATEAEITESKRVGRFGGSEVAPVAQDFRPTGTIAARVVARNGRVTIDVENAVAGAPALECPMTVCDERRVRSIAWVPGRQTIAIHSQLRDGGWRIDEWRPGKHLARLIVRAPGMLSGDWRLITPCAAGSATLLCVSAGPAMPPRVIAIDIASGKTRILAVPTASRVEAIPKRITWSTPEGIAFSGVYFTAAGPRTGSRSPLFITYNGCTGYPRGGTGDEWPLALFAQAGIAALCINPPAVAARAEDDTVESYRTALAGVRSAIGTLDRAGQIDPRRVGMGGLSFSSEVTAWVLSHSTLLAAASLASVLMEPTYYWFNPARNDDMRVKLRQWWGLGAPDETPERWKALSLALNVDAVQAPILFQIPEQEYRYNLELVSRLVAARKPVEMVAFPDEAHVKFQPVHRLSVYQRNLAWFAFWLKDTPCPKDCGRRGDRWDALRAMHRHRQPATPMNLRP